MPSALAIKTLDELPAGPVQDYLRSYGIAPEIIDWKYYDAQFNRARPRGCVWVRDEKVLGFLGLIPFRFRNQSWQDAAWCCDWSIDPSQSGAGAGIMLVKHAQSLYPCLFGIEGSEITRRLFPRLATSTFPAAGVRMQLNLRLGVYTQKIANHFPALSMGGWPGISQIPLRFLKKSAAEKHLRVDCGVSPAIPHLLDNLGADPWRPAYDLQYVDWQIGRCPALISNTCYFPDAALPEAAIVCWRPRMKNAWRIAVLALDQAWDQVPALLSTVIRHIYNNRGTSISMVARAADKRLTEILTDAGFSTRPEEMPLYVVTPRRAESVPELSHLSYLDCDLAYRF